MLCSHLGKTYSILTGCFLVLEWMFLFFCTRIFFVHTTVLSLKTAFNLVKIHLLFCIMILIQWSVNISVFVNHVVIGFLGPKWGRPKTYIYTPSVFKKIYIYIYIYIYVWKLNQTVLELDFRAVKFLFFPRWDFNPHHWYTAAP
jgi:hypothetical protein